MWGYPRQSISLFLDARERIENPQSQVSTY